VGLSTSARQGKPYTVVPPAVEGWIITVLAGDMFLRRFLLAVHRQGEGGESDAV